MADKKLLQLMKQYSGYPNIQLKIDDFIENQLPKLIHTYVEREKRQKLLNSEMETYITAFFSDANTQFYYIATTNIFIHYTDNHYKMISEDDIWHTILSDISSKEVLNDWKYKVKTKIVKQIRERNVLHSIPESITIQHILHFLTPTFFKTKEQAKYFLTCIGDSVLKKNQNLVHFINPQCKSFISGIHENCNFLFNNTIAPIESFKYRYHEHKYSICRLLYFDHYPSFNHYWHHFLKSYILDIIVVACHYSSRFLNSDNYIINHCNHDGIRDYILYVKNKNKEGVVDNFIQSFLIKGKEHNNLSITWNNMYFLWREYLQSQHLPNILFKEQLKENLMNKLSFHAETHSFLNVSSKHLKYVQFFTEFWNKTIYDMMGNNFEVEELCTLYKNWLKQEHPREKCLQENKMISLLQYFYPKYTICNQKYISNISSTLWNKEKDIQLALEEIKQGDVKGGQTFYQMYELYCKYAKHKPLSYIVSKKYFENRLRTFIPVKYLVGDSVKESYWKS